MTLKEQLEAAHDELLRELDVLEDLTAAEVPDETALAATRLRLSRVSIRRTQLLGQDIIPAALTIASEREARAITQLRQDIAAARTHSSEHVVYWSLKRVKEDWSGYQEASARMRKEMRTHIAQERQTLAPLLSRID